MNTESLLGRIVTVVAVLIAASLVLSVVLGIIGGLIGLVFHRFAKSQENIIVNYK